MLIATHKEQQREKIDKERRGRRKGDIPYLLPLKSFLHENRTTHTTTIANQWLV